MDKPHDPRHSMGDSIFALVLQIPTSREHEIERPAARARAVSRSAARQAGLLAATLALPPGLLSWLTVLPELLGVWKLQAQMVADIAAIYGKTAALGREQMMFCLFKHVSAQLFRDVVVRVGERYVIQHLQKGVLQSIAKTLGLKISQNLIGKSAVRLVPLLGAVGVSAYAYFDTTQVANTAIALFSSEIILDSQEK